MQAPTNLNRSESRHFFNGINFTETQPPSLIDLVSLRKEQVTPEVLGLDPTKDLTCELAQFATTSTAPHEPRHEGEGGAEARSGEREAEWPRAFITVSPKPGSRHIILRHPPLTLAKSTLKSSISFQNSPKP